MTFFDSKEPQSPHETALKIWEFIFSIIEKLKGNSVLKAEIEILNQTYNSRTPIENLVDILIFANERLKNPASNNAVLQNLYTALLSTSGTKLLDEISEANKEMAQLPSDKGIDSAEKIRKKTMSEQEFKNLVNKERHSYEVLQTIIELKKDILVRNLKKHLNQNHLKELEATFMKLMLPRNVVKPIAKRKK